MSGPIDRVIGIGALIVVAAGIVWWAWREPVKLDERDDGIAIALYRACNQKDLEGLQKIETQCFSGQDDDFPSTDSGDSIKSIIRQAKTGDWKQAAIECRQWLDDQHLR